MAGVSHEGIGKIKALVNIEGVRVHKRYASSQRARDYTKDIRVHKGYASTQREIESKRRSSRVRGYTNGAREYAKGARVHKRGIRVHKRARMRSRRLYSPFPFKRQLT